jgi:hypothetical protein
VPYGTDSRLNLFQAINCLATIIQSLRDKSPDAERAVGQPLGVLSLTFLPLHPRIIRPKAPKVPLEIATSITAPTITGVDNI